MPDGKVVQDGVVPHTAQHFALAALIGAVPAGMVDDAVRVSGREAVRLRALPPWVTMYHLLASALCAPAGYDEVTHLLWAALPASTGRGLSLQAPSRGAITRARARLGSEPLEELLAELLRNAAARDATREVYLHRFETSSGQSLWWTWDAATGWLRGCDLRGDVVSAGADVAEASGAARIIVCPPVGEQSRGLLERLGGFAAVTVGDLPTGVVVPWERVRARTPRAWRQDILALACVRVAHDIALRSARAAQV